MADHVTRTQHAAGALEHIKTRAYTLEITSGPQAGKKLETRARLISVDQLARVIKPLEHALERAEKTAGGDTGAGRVTGRISNLPGARGG